jgi:DNA-binding response OmpR family regulator
MSYPKRELQATLIQLEADLRRLTATVQALASCLSQSGVVDGLPDGSSSGARAFAVSSDVPPFYTGVARGWEADGPARSAGSAAAAGTPKARWSLREGGWTLVSPSGQRMALTTLERKFMLALFEANNHSLARNELSALAPEREPGERPGPSPRGVDVMVSRLRRKAQALGIPLPLRSVRRWGYMFTEDAVTE